MGSETGIVSKMYKSGETYDMADSLANVFVGLKVAEEVKKPSPVKENKKAEPVVENKKATKKGLK